MWLNPQFPAEIVTEMNQLAKSTCRVRVVAEFTKQNKEKPTATRPV